MPLVVGEQQLWDIFLPNVKNSSSFWYSVGLVFIFCQCIVWIVAAVMTQHIYESHDMGSPFLMTYLGMALLTLFLPIEMWNEWRSKASKQKAPVQVVAQDDSDISINSSTSFDSFAHDLSLVKGASCIAKVMTCRTQDLLNASKKQKRWNHKKHMLAALYIAPGMFLADWALNLALLHTSVASATVLVSVQNMVVFLLAVLCKIEDFCWAKLAGVVLSMVGIALTAYHDSDDNNGDTALLGDLFAVIAALSYGTYTVLVRLFCPQDEHLYNMQLLLGYIGLVVLLPLLPFAGYNLYILRHNITWTVLGFIFVKGFLDFVLTDYLMFRSIMLTSATVATVGMGLTIPMAFITDCILHPDGVISVHSVIGAATVGAGFLCVSLSPGSEMKADENDQQTQEPSANFVMV